MQNDFSVTLDEEDFVAAFRMPPKQRRLRALTLVLAAVLALMIALLLIRFPQARLALASSMLFMGLVGSVILAATLVLLLLLSAPALRRRAARSTLDHHPGMRDPVHYSFGPEHFAARSTYTQACYPWAQLWDWRECGRIVLILPTPRNFFVVPKRAISPEALDRLRGYLAHARRRTT